MSKPLSKDALRPHLVASSPKGESEIVNFRLSTDTINQLDEMTYRLKPRFRNRSDLVRTAVIEYLEKLAGELGDGLTQAIILQERVISDGLFLQEQAKRAADMVRTFELNVRELLDADEMDELAEFLSDVIGKVNAFSDDFMRKRISRGMSKSDLFDRAIRRLKNANALRPDIVAFIEAQSLRL